MKKVFLSLFVLLSTLTASAIGFTGSDLTDGGQYYLFNIYQQKFLSYGNTWGTQVSLDNKKPLLCTINASGSGYTINTHYSLTDKAYKASYDNYICLVSGTPVVNANYGDTDDSYTHRDAQVFTFTKGDYGYTISYTDGVERGLMFGTGSACVTDTLSKSYYADKSIWKLVSVDDYTAYTAKTRFTMAALNVDGMPKSIKIAGVYDLSLNPDAKEEDGATAIGHKLKTMGWDVIGVSEDFNFHSQIWNQAWNNGVDNAPDSLCYNATTHRGSISVTASTYTKFISSTSPLFETDGLCLFYKTSNVDQSTLESSESWTAWSTHYGYTNDGADGMIDKGYRYYTVKLKDCTEIDLYILHMDAEDSESDNAAREIQMTQLVNAIRGTNNKRPIIVMGDTNCRYTRDHVKTLFIDALNEDERFTVKDTWIEFGRDGAYPTYGSSAIMVDAAGYRKGEVVDKIFYINNKESDLRINPITYTRDLSFINDAGEPLADHWPAVCEFEYHTYDPAIDDVATESKTGTYYLRNKETGYYLKAGGWWGTHAVQGTYGKAFDMTQLATGKYELGGLTQGDPYTDGTSASWTLLQDGKYYSFVYDNNGTTMALTGDDATTFPDEPGPNKRYVTCAAYNAMDNYQKWELLTLEDLYNEMIQNASTNNPYNCTFLLKDANFDRNDANGASSWTNNISSSASRMTSNLSDGKNDFAYGNSCAEAYVATGSSSASTTWEISQTISNLPNGNYKITAQAFQRISNSTSTTAEIYLYGRSGSTENKIMVPLMYDEPKITDSSFGGSTQSGNYYYPNTMSEATLYFNAGYYQTTVPTIEVNDNNLTVAIGKTSTTGKNNSAWTCFDNFQIYYFGADDDIYDVNNDGKYTIRDAADLIHVLDGGTAESTWKTDINGDGKTTMADLDLLIDYLLEK